MDALGAIEWLKPAASHEITADPQTASGLLIHFEDVLNVMKALYENPSAYFDQLACVTGLDNGPEAKTMEVIYQLNSIPHGNALSIRTILSREQPEVESIASIWKSANWLEREVYDMFGINFRNHPDLRRILMPNDWIGYPLRKDYEHQETYRDIMVRY